MTSNWASVDPSLARMDLVWVALVKRILPYVVVSACDQKGL
jgi:hypothetical protein